MLKLNNVCKTYVSKSKQRVEALKGVNFELGNTGMVFILGKSGSGKSTLLNLLGGLDSATSGEIVVDGVSMRNFKQADYDGYRNGYVGFVFQEYNLLDDFNVKDNIALALQLSKESNIDDKVTSALNQVELNDQYLTRRVGEMSGGEKQRIAIARCIVKDSKMILADEPTGNLDSETGESIWNILKNLSKSKLVVVVSHDRESADKYADRIIEISDGKVIADRGSQPDNEIQVAKQSFKRKRLPLSVSIKMGLKSMFQRKVKTVSVILVSILSILALLVTQMMLSFSPEMTIAQTLIDHNVGYFKIFRKPIDLLDNFDGGICAYMPQGAIDYIQHNSLSLFGRSNGNITYVESKQQVLDMGYKFVGDALELDENSFYISVYARDKMFYYDGVLGEDSVEWGGDFVEIDGKRELIDREKYPIDYLIGKKIYSQHFMAYKRHIVPMTFAGVIDIGEDYNDFYNPLFFIRQDCANIREEFSLLFNRYNFGSYDQKEVNVLLGNHSTNADIRFNDHYSLKGKTVVTPDGQLFEVKYDDDYLDNLRGNEIFLTYNVYAQLFDAKPKDYYISQDYSQLYAIPEGLGQEFEFKLTDYTTGQVLFDLGTVKLAGIDFRHGDFNIIVHNDTMRKLERSYEPTVTIKTDSVRNLGKFLTDLREDYNIFLTTLDVYGSDVAYQFESKLETFIIVFGTIAVILTLVLVLLVINLISFSIAARKKEIGILSALGTTNKDITKIFIVETLIISLICFAVTLVLTVVASSVFNDLFVNGTYDTLPLMRVDYITVSILAVSSVGFLLLSALLPIRKIARLKPIDAIRNL